MRLAQRKISYAILLSRYFGSDLSGDRSSVGRVPDCDSGCRGFEPHRSPQNSLARLARAFLCLLTSERYSS